MAVGLSYLLGQGIEIPKDTTIIQYKKIPNHQPMYCDPLFFIDDIVASQTGIKTLNPEDVKDVQVIKSYSGKRFKYPNLTEMGVVLIQLRKPLQIPCKKLSEINHFFRLSENHPIYINSYLAEDHSLEIYIDAIKEIEKVIFNGQEVLNIWTFSRKTTAEKSKTHSCRLIK